MEEKDDWTCGREGDRHPFTEINLQDEFVTPFMLVLNYTDQRIVLNFSNSFLIFAMFKEKADQSNSKQI